MFCTQVSSDIQPSVSAEEQCQPSTSRDVGSPNPALPTFTLYDLKKFQFNFLNEAQLAYCEELFMQKNFKEPNPIYQAWLQLKLASLPTEAEALQAVLHKHSPENLPKRKKMASKNVPVGPPRFNPISQEWVEILEARENQATILSAKAKKTNVVESQEAGPAMATDKTVTPAKTFECDQCGKFYATKGSLRTHKYNHKKSQQMTVGSAVKDMEQQED